MTVNTIDETLDKIINSNSLPTLPAVASKLVTLTSQQDTPVKDIASLILHDISLSSKLLRVVNSAFYSMPNQISTIQQAVSILGINAVRSLVLSFSFLDIKPAGINKDKFDYHAFWKQSLTAAVASKIIAEKLKVKDPEEFFIASLLQNIGELVLARSFPDLYSKTNDKIAAGSAKTDILSIEQNAYNTDHCVTGYKVCEHWGLPDILVIPIRFHHNPDEYHGDDKRIKTAIRTVFLSGLVAKIVYTERPDISYRQFLHYAKKWFSFSEESVDAIFDEVQEKVQEASRFFGLNVKLKKTIEEILQEANAELSVLNLSYEQMNRELIKTKVQLQKSTKELEKKNRQLKKLANVDGLTETFNHRYFQEALDAELNRSIRNESALSLIITDIDHFKKINDTYGHQVGDKVLKEFCEVTKEKIREYDLLARYGGEEFVIILPETEVDEAKIVAEKIRNAIAKHFFGNDSIKVTASFGIATIFPSKEEVSKNDFIEKADFSLLQAKKNGRNCVEIYKPKKKWFFD
jgi:diguanylate cyclase (GGDEF)-like protein